MSVLAPWYLLAAAGAAAAVLALHFLARQRPRRAPLPTARFVPERPAHAPSRSSRPTDLLLLAMRALAVLLVGVAFARPQWEPSRREVTRVVVLDLSRAVRSAAEARDSAAATLREGEGDILVAFDSSARAVRGAARDSLRMLSASSARGSLSAALAAAYRAAAGLRWRADSVELVLVAPLVEEEWDAATPEIRKAWRGRARLVRVAAAESSSARFTIDVRSPRDDPLRAAAALLGARSVTTPVHLLRTPPTPADSQWARDSAHVLLAWPAARVPRWPRRSRVDTVGAATAGSAVVVAPFVREAVLPPGRVVARWVDGEPAAVERPLGAGCVRDIAIAVPGIGDLALRESLRRLLGALAEPVARRGRRGGEG